MKADLWHRGTDVSVAAPYCVGNLHGFMHMPPCPMNMQYEFGNKVQSLSCAQPQKDASTIAHDGVPWTDMHV